MKYLLLLLLLVSTAKSQILALSGFSSATPGSTVQLTVVLAKSLGDLVGVQATFSSTVPLSFTSALASKSSLCTAPAPALPTSIRCGLFGLTPGPTVDGGVVVISPSALFNTTPIPEGSAVAVVGVVIPAVAIPGSTITVTIDNVSASNSVAGALIPLMGSSFNISVIDPRAAASAAFTAWLKDGSDKNFIALELAIAAAQK